MSDIRNHNEPEEVYFPDNDGHEHDVQDLHHRRSAAWVAAGGTFVVIVAFWAMLLPTQLGGVSELGFKNAMGLQDVRAEASKHAPAFSATVQQMQQQLDDAEAMQFEAYNRAAAEEEAALLRARIEASAQNAETAEGTNQPNPPIP